MVSFGLLGYNHSLDALQRNTDGIVRLEEHGKELGRYNMCVRSHPLRVLAVHKCDP